MYVKKSWNIYRITGKPETFSKTDMKFTIITGKQREGAKRISSL